MFLQFIFYFTVVFDISIARQVIGFLYFTFIPGFLLVKLLKLDELDPIENLLLSIGLSIAFLMVGGLLINEFFFLFGVSRPLSLMPLIITFNIIVLIGGVLVYLRSENVKVIKGAPLRTSPFALFLVYLPILSIVGAMLANAYGNNVILLFMIIATSLLFIVGVLSKNLLPKMYPFAILMIALALLYHSSFISSHLVHFSSDLQGEYFAFKTTENGAFWSSTVPYLGGLRTNAGRINAMLSVTVLPTIYSSLLNMDSVWMFKILYPLIFSLVPLGLYQLWRKRFGSKFAFISTFLFMAQETFYTEMLGLNRQMVAEFFFVLLLIAIFNEKMKTVNKTIFFMIFSFALVTSHYGLSQIVLFFISITLIYLVVLKRPQKNVTTGMVVLFFVIMFLWYIYITDSAVFNSILEFGDYVFRQLGDFFNPTARGETVLMGLGLEAPPSIWHTISRAFAYLTQAFIVIGFIRLVTKRTRTHLETEYFVFTLLAVALLVMLILVPGLANTMNMTRFYHILLFFLAPLCVLGAEAIVNVISKRNMELKVSVLLLLVLVPYFLFQTYFVYEVTGSDSYSVPLSKHRMNSLRLHGKLGYTDAYSVFGARWLSNNVAVGHSQIYSDYYSRGHELRGYGLVFVGYVEVLSNVTEVEPSGVLYLSSLNIIEETVAGSRYVWNISEISFLSNLNMVYSNGGSEVYKNMP
jgi:uncharacterized membrane protein